MSRERVIPGGSGRIIRFGPNELTVKTGSESSHALVGVFESALPPGGGFPIPHVREQYEEVFYVLEGEIEYYVGEEWEAAFAGSTVSVPSGVIHAFRNSSPYPARHLVVHAPVTALTMIEELAQATPDQFGAILARHHSRLAER